jgi:hypothetical protein
MMTKSLKPVLKVTLAAALTLPMILAIPDGKVGATPEISIVKPGALTAPPPESQSIQRLAQLENIYQASGNVIPVGGLTAYVSTTTTTYTKMNSITVQYSLQRWTGSEWVTYRSNSVTQNNVSALDASSNWTVVTGYYYRVVSIHSANNGSKTETTTHTSSNVLF